MEITDSQQEQLRRNWNDIDDVVENAVVVGEKGDQLVLSNGSEINKEGEYLLFNIHNFL